MKWVESAIEKVIFGSRWLLAPIYLGLVVAQCAYSVKFGLEVAHLLADFRKLDHIAFMQIVLQLLDIVMIANLVLMILVGGYATFVSRLHVDDHEDRPDWLSHVDPGTLKLKLAGGLVGISGVHLLQTFTKLGDKEHGVDLASVAMQTGIHLTFVFTTLLLAWSELVLEKKLRHRGGAEAGASAAVGGH
jgi:uncharacterized protein (TIGR00645 family)